MRLALVTNLYPPYLVGGNEMLCRDVVEALRARGHRVDVVCGRGARCDAAAGIHGELPLDLDRLDETLLGGRVPGPLEALRLHVWSAAAARATRRALARLEPDVVVVWNLYMASLAPLAAARATRRPLVTHVFDQWLLHGVTDVSPLLHPRTRWPGLVRLAQRALAPRLRAAAVGPVLAVSEFLRRKHLAAGFGPETITVLHQGVDTSAFPARNGGRAGAPGSASTPVTRGVAAGGGRNGDTELRLLYVGALWEGKGPQTAVRALGRLTRAGVAAHLDLCGNGTEHFRRWLEQVVAEEAVGDRVTLHGFVPRERVAALYASHDALVFPSQWDEPFASVPLEAMSCGVPVVATTAGGTAEAVRDGETGLLVPPNDPEALATALRRLHEEPALARRLGEAGARAVRERFDLGDYVGRLETFYEGARGARPSRRSSQRKARKV